MQIKPFNTLKSKTFLSALSFSLMLLTADGIAQPGGYLGTYSHEVDSIIKRNKLFVLNASKDTIEIAGFRNGKKNNRQILFYNNGEVRRTARYKDDLLNGQVTFYSQGRKNPNRIEHYKAFPKENTSKLHGANKIFGADFKLIELTHYKDGKRNGKYERYHNNGQLKEKGTFKEGLNTGNKRIYSAEGLLLQDENYIIIDNPDFKKIAPLSQENDNSSSIKYVVQIPQKLSVLHGRVKYYHYNGLLSADFVFYKGKKEGLCKEFHQDQNNTLKSEVVFKDGLEHGPFAHYRSNGNLERKGKYYRQITVGDTTLLNVYDGTIEIFQDNGKKSRVENWKGFKKNGVQESYYYQTGELSERTFYINNLKAGIEQRFDKDGSKNYEAFFKIIEKDGQKISAQTGLEKYWNNEQVVTLVEWVDGMQEGFTKTYYPNGQLKSRMQFKNGKLSGTYQTYYENGQLKEDYNKTQWVGTGNSENVGWNTTYDEAGNIRRRFFATGDTKNIIEENFENNKRKNLYVANAFSLEFYNDYQLRSVHWLNFSRPAFGYDLFSNKQLRKVHFSSGKHPFLAANLTAQGEVIEIITATGAKVKDSKAQEDAKKIAMQFNPKWEEETLATESLTDGRYQWNYNDGSAFFNIEFKDGLPQGEWIAHNPILQDTLFYGEFNKGLLVGKLVRKKMDGTPELRQEYFPNHKLKSVYRYDVDGLINEFYKNDSLENRIFSENYYPGGKLQSRSIPTSNSYLNLSDKGDTLSYRQLFTKADSIRIERQFFEGNKIKVDRYNNLTSGIGSVKTYFENNQLQTSHELKNSKPHGVYRKYRENGTLEILGHFKDGNRDGEWIHYKEDGSEEISCFKEGEILITKMQEDNTDENSCRCYDTSLPGNKIGFANSLAYFADYKSIKPYIPKSILPINSWNYDKMFYVNLRTNNDRGSGATHLKLLLFQDFSFYYPTSDYLKINLNPCRTEGYIGNIDTSVSYDFENKKLMYAQLSTKRIAVSLEKNPLTDAKNNGVFTAYFDTENMNFDEGGIQSIRFSENRNECYPLGLINDFMEINIESASLDIHPKNRTSTSIVPLLANEIQQFYGLDISSARLQFTVDAVDIEATCLQILAGANYVAGKVSIAGKLKNEEEFTLENANTIQINRLTNVLEQKGFYRVNIEAMEDQLLIAFYTEK